MSEFMQRVGIAAVAGVALAAVAAAPGFAAEAPAQESHVVVDADDQVKLNATIDASDLLDAIADVDVDGDVTIDLSDIDADLKVSVGPDADGGLLGLTGSISLPLRFEQGRVEGEARAEGQGHHRT